MTFRKMKVIGMAMGATTLMLMQGCQSYRASPVDLNDYSQRWEKQFLADETLVEFANGLLTQQLAQESFDVMDGLSLKEAQLISLLFNPQLSQDRIESRLPLIRKKRSALFPDPEIELNFEPVTEGVDEKWLLNAQLSFVLPISFRARTEIEKIDSEYQVELKSLLNTEQQTISRVHDMWVQLYTIEKKQQVLNDHLRGLDSVIEQAGQSLSLSGGMSAADLQSLALEAATVRADLLALREQRIEQFVALTSAMGLKADTPLQFHFAMPVVGEAPAKVQWSALLITNDADLQVSKARYQVAERNLELEIKKQYPDLVVGPIYQQGESQLGLNLSALVPFWNRNLPAIEGAHVARQVARKELERVYQHKVNTLLGLAQRLAVLQEREGFLKKRLAPMIDQQFENIWQSIQLGSANVLLLQDTLRQRLDGKIDLLDTVAKRVILQNQMSTMLEPVHRDLAAFNKTRNTSTNSEGE